MATSATTELRFRLLGPLEVLRDGEPLHLGGERQRGLLALLLVHANELVTTEQLAEQLFGAGASEASVRAVRVAVSRLRRLLDDETLVTRPGGYVVHADSSQLDVAEFEALVLEGRSALGNGDATTAAATFRSALALFRGAPLADIALLDFVQPEARRLEELRLSALMDRIDADLALGRGAELVPELEGLVQANLFQERLRGQLMLALYRSGRQTDALEVYRSTRELLADELGLEPSRALQQLERSMLQHDPALDLPERARTVEPAVCPFKGLAAFEAADAFYFCGRERLLAELVARLASGTFVGIVGPSGAGKSSLLRAGVLPALGAGALPGSGSWRVVLLRPGDRASVALAETLDACGVGERVVIAVDQLEEIFAEDVPAEERTAFLDELERAAADPARRALLLVTVRADFYGRFADNPRLADRLSQSHVFLRALDRDELARAVEVPAGRAGLEVERPLVGALVADTAGAAGALPLLQTTLLQLWAAREGNVLRYGAYRAMGGVRGAVARLAEETYTSLPEGEQEVGRRVMLRLAGGEEGALVRRRLPLADVLRIAGAGPVIDALVTARLLTVDDAQLELSHEALLQEWPRYRGWLEDDRVGRRVHEHLTASADDWAARGRDAADLYRGARLGAALELPAAELTEREREFLDASRAAAGRELRQAAHPARRCGCPARGRGLRRLVALHKSHTASAEARGGARRSARGGGDRRAPRRPGDAARQGGAPNRPAPRTPRERSSPHCCEARLRSRRTRFPSTPARRTSPLPRAAATSWSPTTPAICASTDTYAPGATAAPERLRLRAAGGRVLGQTDGAFSRSTGRGSMARPTTSSTRRPCACAGACNSTRGCGRTTRCSHSSGCSHPIGRTGLYVYGDPTRAWVRSLGPSHRQAREQAPRRRRRYRGRRPDRARARPRRRDRPSHLPVAARIAPPARRRSRAPRREGRCCGDHLRRTRRGVRDARRWDRVRRPAHRQADGRGGGPCRRRPERLNVA